MIDVLTLRELIDYDPDTGVFKWRTRDRRFFSCDKQWKNWNGRYPGTAAGTVGLKGYRAISVLGRFYGAARLAWLYVHGTWPTHEADHENGDKDDNRIGNLRDVPGAVNSKNRRLQRSSVTGRAGVTPYPYHGRMKYAARIRVDGKLHHLGYFATIEEAGAARAAAERMYGFHPNHGSKSKRPLRSRGFEPSR